MQSAFIDIGLDRAAFLHVADIWEHRRGTATTAPAATRKAGTSRSRSKRSCTRGRRCWSR
jgi:Ribonuclease G/E